MNRKELLEVLEVVKPALASDNLIPIYRNYCFDEGKVLAYKDNLGIVAPCNVTETFSVDGKLFFDMLKSSTVKELTIEMDREDLIIKAGKSRIKLPYKDKSEFIFEEPEQEKWKLMLDMNDDLYKAFELCLLTTSIDSSKEALNGITVKGDDGITLYSSNTDSLTRYKLDLSDTNGTKQEKVTYTIPNEFCEAILRIGDKFKNPSGQLYINENWVFAELGNDYRIYGRIIDVVNHLDFEDMISRNMKGEHKFIPIPKGIIHALNRARVLADPENRPTEIKVIKGKATLYTETHLGVVKDIIRFDKEHLDVETLITAKNIQKPASLCDKMTILDNCSAFLSEDENHLVLVARYGE